MNILKKILFACLATITFAANAQDLHPQIQGLKQDVVFLSSDYLKGRESGKESARMAANYVAYRMQEIGLEPKGTDGSWYYDFDFKFRPNPHSKEGIEDRKGRNVVGYIDNKAKNTVIIGAHFDHLGMGIPGSLYVGDPAIHNGADDNASGVAAILSIAERLKKGASKKHNYLIISFSGEELGLFGSKAYAEHPTIDFSKVSYMINLDMVGRLKEGRVIAIGGVGSSPSFIPAIEGIDVHGIKAKTTPSGIGPSDHTSFYLQDLPVLFFFTGQHGDYHKPTDDAEFINFEGLSDVTDYVMAVIKKLDKTKKLTFTKTKEEQKEKSAAKFKVTLGVMPDYVFDGIGMRIDGVLEDRPAKKAGLLKGDIVIKIGDVEVKDIYDYMDGLAKYKAGDKAMVTVLRDGKPVKSEVTF